MTVFDDFQQDGAFLGIQWYKEGIIEDEQLTPLYLLPVFRASLPLKLNYPKNQAVGSQKVANVSDPH